MFTIWNVFPQSFVLQLACGRYGFMFSVLAFKKNMPNYIELHLFSFPTLFQHDNNNEKRNSQSFFVFTKKRDLIMFRAIYFPYLFRTIFSNSNTLFLWVFLRIFSSLFCLPFHFLFAARVFFSPQFFCFCVRIRRCWNFQDSTTESDPKADSKRWCQRKHKIVVYRTITQRRIAYIPHFANRKWW